MPTPPPIQPASGLHAVTRGGGYDYLLSLPPDYATASGRRWPLLFFLHGAAPRGNDVWSVAQQGLPRLLAGAADLSRAEAARGAEIAASFVVVAPQCPHYEVWDDDAVLALLDDVGSALNIDAARVYLTGLSMGGFGAWSVGLRYPHRFAALLAVCGGGRVADVETAARTRRAALTGLGVWAFHGARDVVVPPEESERMIEALKRAGVRDARLTLYPEADHDAWTATYANAAIYPWLLGHAR